MFHYHQEQKREHLKDSNKIQEHKEMDDNLDKTTRPNFTLNSTESRRKVPNQKRRKEESIARGRTAKKLD